MNYIFKNLFFLTVLFCLSGTALAVDNDLDNMTLESSAAALLNGDELDLDGDQRYDALTDGLLILRSMFGLTGDALISGAISDSAEYSSSAEIESRFRYLESLLDVDENGDVDALTDGLIILRYLFGLSGEKLISDVTADDAQRSDAYEISSYLGQLARLDVEACSNSS